MIDAENRALVFGTWQIERRASVAETIEAALAAGYRCFDTAAGYGNDFSVGKAIKKSGIPREELFLTNKLWNTCRDRDKVKNACKQSLRLMKQEYFDCYLIHWPWPMNGYPDWEDRNLETWRAMEELISEGLVRSIGVSNFAAHHLQILLEKGTIRPAVDQVELHPGKPQQELLAYCRQQQIQVQAWSPLGHGKVLQDERVLAIAAAHGKTAAQICLRFCLEQGASVVTSSVNPGRMLENRQIFDFELEPSEKQILEELEGVGNWGLDPDDKDLEQHLAEL